MNSRSQREKIKEYNKKPHKCKYCGEDILCDVEQGRLKDIKVKKFCNNSCSAKYNNFRRDEKTKQKAKDSIRKAQSIIYKKKDKTIREIFNESASVKEFKERLGIKEITSCVKERFLKLGIDLETFRAKNRKLKENKITKGDLVKKIGYTRMKSAITKWARRKFEKSEKDKCCAICGYKKSYQVAHIKAVSSFCNNEKISKINDLDNLIALCPNHHWEYDMGMLSKKDERKIKKKGKGKR